MENAKFTISIMRKYFGIKHGKTKGDYIMKCRGNDRIEDALLCWMDMERYMTEFKEGNFENYDICQETLRHLAVRHLMLEGRDAREKGKEIQIPEFMRKR